MRLVQENVYSIDSYEVLILALKLALQYLLKDVIQNNKCFIEKMWLQIVNKGCLNVKIAKRSLYCVKWLAVYLSAVGDINKFLYEDKELDEIEFNNYLKELDLYNKSEDCKEVLGQTLIHYCVLLLSIKELNEIPKAIKVPIQVFKNITKTMNDQSKLINSAYKFYATYSQSIENELSLNVGNKDSLKQLLTTKLQMIEYKHNPQIISCTLYSLSKILNFFDPLSISHYVKEFLRKCQALSIINETELYHQIAKCYLKVLTSFILD